jgi:hypothetical protein
MGKKYRNLIGEIADINNLRSAYQQARSGNRFSAGALSFKEHAEENLHELGDAIYYQTYKPGPYSEFKIFHPKPRNVAALPFSDRVVQHALVNIIGPIFDKTLLPVTFACRKGFGTHACMRRAQAIIRKLSRVGDVFVLKMDFAQYFASIDRSILYKEIERKISCQSTLWLIERFTPRSGIGLPIGNLTSQLWANVYGGIVDKFVKHDLRESYYLRYMDDSVIFSQSRARLKTVKILIQEFISAIGLKFSKWSIINASKCGLNYVGYRIWPNFKLLRRSSVIQAKRKIIQLRDKPEELSRFLAAWKGHAQWANSYNLLKKMELLYG